MLNKNIFLFSFLKKEVPPKGNDWATALDVWEALLDAEASTTTKINEIMNLAKQLNDHTTSSFLKEHIDIQVASEYKVSTIVEKVRAYMSVPGLLYHLDHELKLSAEI